MQFFFIAYGSACELETRNMTSADLGYLKKERLQKLRREIGDVGAMFKAMIKSLERKPLNPWILGSLAPIRQLSWRRTINLNVGFFPDLLTLNRNRFLRFTFFSLNVKALNLFLKIFWLSVSDPCSI